MEICRSNLCFRIAPFPFGPSGVPLESKEKSTAEQCGFFFYRCPVDRPKASLLELQVYDFGWFGLSGQTKYHWLFFAAGGWPLAFQGLAPINQLSKSRTKNNLQAKYRTPDPNKIHNSSKSCSRQTTTPTKSMVSRNLTIQGCERKLTKMNWMDASMKDAL